MHFQRKAQHWLQSHTRLTRHWLAHCPAAVLFPIGLALGSAWATLALLGIGGWGGLFVCTLLLGAVVPLLIGAEPVMRQFPSPVLQPATNVLDLGSLPDITTPPDDPATIRTVEDIPGLLTMVELPGGTFLMGSPESDAQAGNSEKPQHEVTVSGFAIACYLVTRQLYRHVMGNGPQQWERDQDETLPANYLNWFEAVAFCNTLSTQQGFTPCYHIHRNDVTWDRDADGYRLPTEAEWEYAVRAETTTRWFCGDEPTELGRYAWFDEER